MDRVIASSLRGYCSLVTLLTTWHALDGRHPIHAADWYAKPTPASSDTLAATGSNYRATLCDG